MCSRFLNFSVFKTDFTIPTSPLPCPISRFILPIHSPSQEMAPHSNPKLPKPDWYHLSPSLSTSTLLQSTINFGQVCPPGFMPTPDLLDQAAAWSTHSQICPFNPPRHLHIAACMSFLSSNLIVVVLGLKPFRASFRKKDDHTHISMPL